MRRLICAFVARNQEKVRVSRVYAHMMLKPRLPGLRLATRLILLIFCTQSGQHSIEYYVLSHRCHNMYYIPLRRKVDFCRPLGCPQVIYSDHHRRIGLSFICCVADDPSTFSLSTAAKPDSLISDSSRFLFYSVLLASSDFSWNERTIKMLTLFHSGYRLTCTLANSDDPDECRIMRQQIFNIQCVQKETQTVRSIGPRESKFGKKWPESSRILDYILG